MDRGTELSLIQPEAAVVPPSNYTPPRTPEIDIDRLVWDPEYRNAMRPIIKHAC